MKTIVMAYGLMLVPALAGAATASESKPLPAAPNGFDVRRENIERGRVAAVEYDSRSVGVKRKMVIYTPPGYPQDAKYPILYLLHGAGDDETGWTRKGAAAEILDNLYADKKLVPMIVVMPNGFARPSAVGRCSTKRKFGRESRRKTGQVAGCGAEQRLRGRFAEGRYSFRRVALSGEKWPREPGDRRVVHGRRAGPRHRPEAPRHLCVG